jgi:hypothetical protein
MTPKRSKNLFPLWKFLNQPLFDAQQPAILNPHRFWYIYNVRHLERCWSRAFRPEEHFRS